MSWNHKLHRQARDLEATRLRGSYLIAILCSSFFYLALYLIIRYLASE